MTTDTITGILDHDGDIIATTLLNVTIMAADRRGGRRILNVGDFNAYKAMLKAADGIRPAGQVEQAKPVAPAAAPEAIESNTEAVAQAASTALPPNRL